MDNLSHSFENNKKPLLEENNASSYRHAFQEKLFLDGYEINQPTNKTWQSLPEQNNSNRNALSENQAKEISQALHKEAIREITQRLLLEIIFLAAIYRYYQQYGYRQPGSFNANPYPKYSEYPDSNPDQDQTPDNIPYLDNPYQFHPGKPHHSVKHHMYAQQVFKQWRGTLSAWLANDTKALASASSNNLVDEARHNLGKPVWAFTKFASVCQSGYLGCAATVSDLLQHAGVKIAGSASVAGVVGQLNNLGWHKIKISDKHQFHSGDIVFGLNSSHGHIGIISEVNKDQVFVCDNSSSSGTLKERTIERGGSFTPDGRFAGHLYVMRKS